MFWLFFNFLQNVRGVSRDENFALKSELTPRYLTWIRAKKLNYQWDSNFFFLKDLHFF